MTGLAMPAPITTSAITRGIAISAVAHALAVASFVVFSHGGPVPLATTTYRVTLVAAPRAPAASAAPGGAAAPVSPKPAVRAAVPATARPTVHRVPTPPPPPTLPARTRPVAHPAPTTPAPTKPAPAPRVAPTPAHTAPVARKPAPSPPRPATTPVKVREGATASSPTAATAAKLPATIVSKPDAVSKPTSVTKPTARGGDTPTDHPAGTGAAAARGRDVADVRVVGLEFPFPGYLDNLVRQVRVRFAPTQTRAPLHADLAFVVGRDGSVAGLRVVRGSGNYAFDLEAQGAVEAAGSARAFGALPDGFHGTSLPVTFSFDPRSAP